MSTCNYLLTGITGFLGHIIQEYLVREGQTVVGLDEMVKSVGVDITGSFCIKSKLKIDTIIHAAGKAHIIPHNQKEEQAFFEVNFEGTKNLCLAFERISSIPPNFIFISTVSVYGVDSGTNIDEQHPLKGKSPYAKSKIVAEEWLQEWAKKNNIRLTILRLPLVAGPNPPGNLGALIKGIKTGRYLSIGKANAKKSIVLAEDVAKIIPAVAEKGGVYNLTDGYHPTFGELEAAICNALGKKTPYSIPVPVATLLAHSGDVLGKKFPLNTDKLKKITSTLTFDDSKARKLLNWDPTPVLSEISKIV